MSPINSSGYAIERLLSEDELSELRSRINEQIRKVLKEHDPQGALLLNKTKDPLRNYHEIGDRGKHGDTWNKSNRILSEADAKWFKNTEGISKLLSRYNAVRISDEEGIGRSNFYWRITRPLATEDVGPIHRDEWFWILNNNFNEDLAGLKRVKVWIAIQTEPGSNGLLVQPLSQQRADIEWEGRDTESIIKPTLITHIEPESMELLYTPPGFGVIFHDRLLHGGALNLANECRCSIEFTLLAANTSC